MKKEYYKKEKTIYILYFLFFKFSLHHLINIVNFKTFIITIIHLLNPLLELMQFFLFFFRMNEIILETHMWVIIFCNQAHNIQKKKKNVVPVINHLKTGWLQSIEY